MLTTPFLTAERALDLGSRRWSLISSSPAPTSSPSTPLTEQTRNILSPRIWPGPRRRADRQLRARRADREAALKAACGERACRRRGARCVRRGAGKENALFGAPNLADAAPGRLDHRGAGQRRDSGRRADERLSGARRRLQRAQHAVAHRREAPSCALYGLARSSARWSVRSRARASPAYRSRSRARPPSSTRSRSPARCWPD